MSSTEPNNATASTVPVVTRQRRRETARAVVQRLHAVPVQLFPPHTSLAEQGSGAAPAPRQEYARGESARCDALPDAAAVKSELGAHSLCLLTGSAPALSATALSGALAAAAVTLPLRRVAYQIAAAHALCGGRVLFLCAPACPSFSVSAFALEVERQWVAAAAALSPLHDRMPSPRPPRADGAACGWDAAAARVLARQEAVVAAVARVEVLSCASLADVYAICHTYTFPSPAASPADATNGVAEGCSASEPANAPAASAPTHTEPSSRTASAPGDAAADGEREAVVSSRRVADIIPLCIVDALTGPTTVTTLHERATGKPCPVPHYLLCLLQRRLQCAVLVVELPASTAASAAAGEGRFPSRAPAAAAPPPEESVLAESDLVRRLRTPHEHAAFETTRVSGRASGRVADSLTKAARTEAGRVDVALPRQQQQQQAPPVSLHDVHFSVLYVEVAAVAGAVPAHNTSDFAWRATAAVSPSSPSLLAPYRLDLQYRVHLMKTTLTEAPSNNNARGSSRLWPRGEAETGRDSVASASGWSSSVASWSARSSRRNSAAYAPSYSGTWVLGSPWCYFPS